MSEERNGLAHTLALLRRASRDRHFALEQLDRAFGRIRAAALFRGCEVGARVSATGMVRVSNQGRLVVGERSIFVGGMVPTELVCRPGAILSIGAQAVFNYGVSIDCAERVTIGERCMLASFVRIADRVGDRRGRITIGDHVWIAHGAIIEPGVTIGNNAVVSAGSVVTKDVPPDSLAIGNPARSMKLDAAGGA